VLKLIALLSLLAVPAHAGDFDGVWQGKSAPSDDPWTPGEPHYGGHYRYEIDGMSVHYYVEIDGAFVEQDKDCKWRIRMADGGAVLSEEPCVRGELTLTLTTGCLLKRKDADTLIEASVSVDADGVPNRPAGKPAGELVRVR